MLDREALRALMKGAMAEGLEWWIDRGGTFTDCVARDPKSGEIRVIKVRSTDGAVEAALGAIEPERPASGQIKLGTTLATNAILERRGAPTVLVTSAGLEDLPTIGDQRRPELFSLCIHQTSPLAQLVIGVQARTPARGGKEPELDAERLRAGLEAARGKGAESVAVVLLHAWRDGALERAVERVACAVGFEHVSMSHEVLNKLGLLARMDTTLANAYTAPSVTGYFDALGQTLPGWDIQCMQSHGGLIDADKVAAKDMVLSGPAAGAVATAAIANALGIQHAIGFDMGGTSTDVSRYDGALERRDKNVIGGVRVHAPTIAIHTVAAGGGSVCDCVGDRLVVGPRSAGAVPGPLCYGDDAASEPALTDAAVVLGRLAVDRFPFELNTGASARGMARLADKLAEHAPRLSAEQVAAGLVEIAANNMASAIRQITVNAGHDARDHSLVAFGGAAGQYACAVARELGIQRVVFHPLAGVLSAYGMGVANNVWRGQRDAGRIALAGAEPSTWVPTFESLEEQGRRALARTGTLEDTRANSISTSRHVALCYQTTDAALHVEAADIDTMKRAFEQAHQQQFGYTRPGYDIEILSIHSVAIREREAPALPRIRGGNGQRSGTQRLWSRGRFIDVPVYRREDLGVGQGIAGPAIVGEDIGTIVVEEGFCATMNDRGILSVNANIATDKEKPQNGQTTDQADPILLEVFRNRFSAIAEHMGAVLERTAVSTNIRDRRDFSCAIFDAGGGLVANAPHIPVHLGAMSETVKAIIEQHPAPEPGSMFASNDPAAGGSHLPDITVVAPVFVADRLSFYVASRGHHADVGGISPGSMPPASRSIVEEGVVLRGETVVDGGVLQEQSLLRLLGAGPNPARRPQDNLADLQAQVAANARGSQLLAELVEQYDVRTVLRYMNHIQAHATSRTRNAIARLPDGTRGFEDTLDDGSTIAVSIEISGDSMSIDFSGSAGTHPGNLNAPRAVTLAAVLYVLRLLTQEDMPLNSGCLEAVQLHIPVNSILDPAPGAAVAAGNVETSQRIVDVLLGALELAAASQGTMNNLSFGNETMAYYETLGGGVGATPHCHGASAVHSHMTNSKCTDPEILETRFPVRLREFSIRRESGGNGRRRGGDGLVREIEFLANMTVSVISERRSTAPYGMAGGEPGKPGVNKLNASPIGHRDSFDVTPGDVLRIETPGAGGWGRTP